MRKLVLAAAVAPFLFTGCLVGPNYKRPAPVMAPAFKEAPPEAFFAAPKSERTRLFLGQILGR